MALHTQKPAPGLHQPSKCQDSALAGALPGGSGSRLGSVFQQVAGLVLQPLLNALATCASGVDWFYLHNSSTHPGTVAVAAGIQEKRKTVERVLTTDPGMVTFATPRPASLKMLAGCTTRACPAPIRDRKPLAPAGQSRGATA